MKSIYGLKNIQLMITMAIVLAILWFLIDGISGYNESFEVTETSRLESLIEQYAIQCYATEGAYPPNLDYLVDHYGLVLNEDKYIYEYEPIAENLKPLIRVFIHLDYN